MPLTLATPNVWHVDDRTIAEQPVLQVALTQHVREVEPRVDVGPDVIRADLPSLNLTLAETAALGRALLAEVERAGREGDVA
ncbi:hypothetical protein LY41_000539 [Prauserella halophila]|nr:hypothetical protein [Prauserella halophila]